MQTVLLCVGTVLLLQPTLSLAFADADDADDSGYARTRRGWSMMRLGRGLQMLRLGKRASTSSLDSSAQATPEQMRALLSSMVDEARNEIRRQPPFARGYKREPKVTQDTADDLYSLLGEGYVSRVLPLHYSRLVSQGRFKRSTAGNRFQDQVPEYDQSMDDSRIRAVALPRIGRYLGQLYKYRPVKAVPAPRIGREDFASVDLTDKQSSKQGQQMKREDSQFNDQQSSNDASSGASQMSL
ncbi:myomodulin neuropeptides 2-like [Littorina saxatilis]|uniref:Uncharacterized protein n=1 Tax=Littorina saxatilis TaxID=31220 RepID=A0AAN9B613_9CAEN